jgi:predicted HAD superfamily phosphohydrolase YqeG
MAGIDLHSNNLFCAMVNQQGKRVFEKRLPCDLPMVLQALKPFKKRMEQDCGGIDLQLVLAGGRIAGPRF